MNPEEVFDTSFISLQKLRSFSDNYSAFTKEQLETLTRLSSEVADLLDFALAEKTFGIKLTKPPHEIIVC